MPLIPPSSAEQRDPYYKKTIPFRYAGKSLQFRVSQRLFSSHQIDPGARQLLRMLAERHSTRGPDPPRSGSPCRSCRSGAGAFETALDLGCGYGAIGLSLAKTGIAESVHLIDRDALALDYTRQNAALNAIDNVEVYGSLGYSDATRRDFDLIAMNVPGKAGERVIESLLLGARSFLREGGTVAIVIVKALEELAASLLHGDPQAVIDCQGGRAGYALFEYHFEPNAARDAFADDLDIYLRDEIDAQLAGVDYTLHVARGLPEFELPGQATRLLAEAVQSLELAAVSRAMVLNPGQGHLPVVLTNIVHPKHIALACADLLELRYSERNLVANGYDARRVSSSHAIGTAGEPPGASDLVAALARGGESAAEARALVDHLASATASGGVIAVAGGSTAVTRLESAARQSADLAITSRKRRRGNSVLVLRPVAADVSS